MLESVSMLLFGRYLLQNYLKVLLLSVISFITILLVSRLSEIAHFATLGAPISYLALFTLYQIPYILPLAIPISCLLSSVILFQRLSHTRELVALRAGGLSLKQIIAPLLIAGVFLSLLCFYIVSELATTSHLATRKMAYELTSKNPLLLLQSAKIAKLKGAFVQMDPVQNGRSAQDLVIALNNRANKRLCLCLAKKVDMIEGEMRGEKVNLISSIPGGEIDHLMLENQEKLSSSAPEFARILRKKGWKIANDHLKFSLLRVRAEHFRKEGKSSAKCFSEMARRLSLGIAAFTFTLLGVSFGMEISRNQTKRGIVYVLILSAFALLTFFVGKELDHIFWLATTLFLLPHLLIVAASLWTLSRVHRGIE